ncbi:MAG: hypothetical protein HQK55_16005, partial [Deltaproteobacteria bacterium]|nr:hypothetical protein [Deltaproteobacteria bacterium]
PGYDRGSLAGYIEQKLRDKYRFVSPEEENLSLVLVIAGCKTACADLTPFAQYRIVIIKSEAEGEIFVNERL